VGEIEVVSAIGKVDEGIVSVKGGRGADLVNAAGIEIRK